MHRAELSMLVVLQIVAFVVSTLTIPDTDEEVADELELTSLAAFV